MGLKRVVFSHGTFVPINAAAFIVVSCGIHTGDEEGKGVFFVKDKKLDLNEIKFRGEKQRNEIRLRPKYTGSYFSFGQSPISTTMH